MPEPTPTPPEHTQPPVSPARAKLEAVIEAGRARAAEVVERIINEQPQDYLVAATALNFTQTDSSKPALILTKDGKPVTFLIHPHAFNQISDKLFVPRAFSDRLANGALPFIQLLIHIFNQLSRSAGEVRFLIRTVGTEVRGFLSDKYRRMNSQPLVDAFIGAAHAAGAVPYDGIHTDVSFAVRAILPTVYTIGDGDEIAFGLELASSDFGAQALSVSLYSLRIRCCNLAVFEESLRKVHLGSRLQDDVAFSEKTYELDTRTLASSVVDIVSRDLLPERIQTLSNLLDRAAQEKVSAGDLAAWLKKHVTKAEAEAVTTVFTAPTGIETLPPGQTWWRLSNALSWVAGKTESTARRLDLERLAGKALADAPIKEDGDEPE